MTTAPARTLPERILALHGALAALPHAFGGALALAYYAEPRATVDIDLNVFVPADRYDEVARPLLALGAAADDPAAVAAVARDGQARVMWERTPVDLFFAYDAFHDAAAAARRTVPFADAEIPILAVEHLVVCKVVFDRPRDWVDIDAVLQTGTPTGGPIGSPIDSSIDAAEVIRWVGRITGDRDARYERIVALLTRR